MGRIARAASGFRWNMKWPSMPSDIPAARSKRRARPPARPAAWRSAISGMDADHGRHRLQGRRIPGHRGRLRSTVPAQEQPDRRCSGLRLAVRGDRRRPARLADAGMYGSSTPSTARASFARGDLDWTIAVGLVQDGVPMAGFVYAPVPDECSKRLPGGPALRNGEPIQVRPRETLDGRPHRRSQAMLDHPAHRAGFGARPGSIPWPTASSRVADGRIDGGVGGRPCQRLGPRGGARHAAARRAAILTRRPASAALQPPTDAQARCGIRGWPLAPALTDAAATGRAWPAPGRSSLPQCAIGALHDQHHSRSARPQHPRTNA